MQAQSNERLSDPQRELLRDFGETDFGEMWLAGGYLRTAKSLVGKGLLRQEGRRTFWLTDAGREALDHV